MMDVPIARFKANLWCLLHFGQCVYVESARANTRNAPEEVTFVGTITGSTLNGTAKLQKSFYGKARYLTTQEEPQ